MKYLLLTLLALIATAVIAFEESEGMRSMRLGCEKQKVGLGCTNYANFLIKNGREAEADGYFEKGCQLGNQDGCEKKKWVSNEMPPPEETPKTEPIVSEEAPIIPTPEPIVSEEAPITPTPEPVVSEETPITPPSDPIITEETPVAPVGESVVEEPMIVPSPLNETEETPPAKMAE